MAETVTNDRPPVAKPASRPRSRKARDRQRVGTSATPLIAAGPTSGSLKPKAQFSGTVACIEAVAAVHRERGEEWR